MNEDISDMPTGQKRSVKKEVFMPLKSLLLYECFHFFLLLHTQTFLQLKSLKLHLMCKKSVPMIMPAPAMVTILLLALEENVWSYSWLPIFLYSGAFGSSLKLPSSELFYLVKKKPSPAKSSIND